MRALLYALSCLLVAAAILGAPAPAAAETKDSENVGMLIKPRHLAAKRKELLTPSQPISKREAIKLGLTATPQDMPSRRRSSKDDDTPPPPGGMGALSNDAAPEADHPPGGLGGVTYLGN